MNRRNSEKEWADDFQEFVRTEGSPVPEQVNKAILGRIHKDLNPSSWIVFAKLLGIHALVGTLSLSICNQFGMSPFHTGFSLSEYFMRFGHSTCMFLCGLIFISFTVLLCRPILRAEEVSVLKRNVALQIFGLSTLSLAAFLALGVDLVFTIGLLWFLGAMIGGIFSTLILPRRISWSGSLR